MYKKETADPDEVAEEAKKDIETDAQVVAEELAVSANLSQAESLLKQMEAGGLEVDEETQTKIKAGLRVAERRVASHVALVVDWNSDEKDSLATQMKALQMSKVRGEEEERKHVAIVFDSKTICESGSQAKYRLPPTRAAQVQRLLDAVLSTREDGDLAEGDALVLLDGGREDSWLTKAIVKHLPGKKYETLKHILTYTPDSVEKRMERASKSPLSLHEGVWFLTQTELKCKVQPRLHAQGNTRGNVLGPFAKSSWADAGETWLLPASVKKEVLGKDNLPLPGGSCPVEHEAETRGAGGSMVPVFYHDSPAVVAEELVHYLQAKAVIDLTPGCGNWALQCLRKRIPYLGVALSDRHKDLLGKKLVSRTLQAMSDTADESLYDATYAQALKIVAEASGQKIEKGQDEQPKKRPRKKKETTQGGAGQEDGEGQGATDGSRDQLLSKIMESIDS